VTAGTDRGRRGIRSDVAGAPAIILVEPQLGENIGACARAMMNFGLAEMRLVNPRGPWPNQKAINTSSGAVKILEDAKLYESVADATSDLHRLYATTARNRDMVKPGLTMREAASAWRGHARAAERCGILFGRERTGLENDDIARADALIMVPANPAHASLNLAQAVLLAGYEWYQLAAETESVRRSRKGSQPATREDLYGFFEQLEADLDACGFLYPKEKRPRMVRNIRNIFSRAGLTDQEVRTLRGIVAGLTRKPKRRP
jgi:tRNA/rRNA methyltransferase